MEAKVVNEENAQRKLEVAVGYDELKPYFDEALSFYREEASIEGFRKGKAPKDVIQKKFGNAIEAEALEVALEDFYKEALEETKTEAIAIGKIENMDYKKGQPLKFEVTVEIMPTYSITGYKGVKVKKEVHTLTDAEINSTFERLRDNYSTTLDVHVVSAGNFVTCDIQMLDESDLPIIGKKFTDRRMPLTTQFVGQDMIDGLVGAKQGETRKLVVSSRPPKEGEDPLSIPKDRFEITIRKVEEIQKPALDDEFAKDMGFESMAAFREDILKNLNAQWENESSQKLQEAIIDEIIKNNDIPAPEPLVDNSIQRIGRMIKERLKGQQVSDDAIVERYRPSAIREVKWNLARRKVIELENLKVTEEDRQAYRERVAKENRVPIEEVKLSFKNETEEKNFEDYLLELKAVEWIKSNAVIEEVPDQLSEEKK